MFGLKHRLPAHFLQYSPGALRHHRRLVDLQLQVWIRTRSLHVRRHGHVRTLSVSVFDFEPA